MNEPIELLNSNRFFFRSFVHLLFSAVLTLPVSVILLNRYRSAINRWMRGNPSSPPPIPSGPPPLPLEEAPLAVRMIELRERQKLQNSAQARADEASKASRSFGALYTLAGVLHATATMGIIVIIGRFPFTFETLVGFWVILLWPTALIVGQTAIPNRRLRWMVPLVLLLVVSAVAGRQLSLLVRLWILYVLPPLVLITLVTSRRYRTAGLLVFPGVFFVLTATRQAWLEGGNLQGFAAIVAAVLSTAAVLGLLIWLARRYERRRISDIELTLDLQWLLLTLWQGLCMAVHTGKLSVFYLVPFAIYKLTALAGRSWFRRRNSDNHRLLLLRTFGARHRSERLLDEMGVTWRWLGSIELIGAPDVAGATIDPPEFFAFITGKARDLFVHDESTLARRLKRFDLERDSSGRFRVNECFCFDQIWREAVLRLAQKSSVILMDLRAFSSQRSGCVDELQLLFDHVPLSRVVLLIDKTTQLGDLTQSLKAVSRRRAADSPNDETIHAVDLVRASSEGPGAARNLVERLCAAATT